MRSDSRSAYPTGCHSTFPCRDRGLLTNDLRAIWSEVQEGNPDAWRTIVQLYGALVHTVALRTGLTDPDAEDCAQQTWIALYRARHTVRDPKALPAWLMRTTRRKALRMAKRYARYTDLDASDQLQDTGLSPDKLLEQLELEAHMEFALSQLDPRCQRVLRSLFLTEPRKSYHELAAALGIRPNSFGPLRARCLQQLKEILEKIGYSSD